MEGQAYSGEHLSSQHDGTAIVDGDFGSTMFERSAKPARLVIERTHHSSRRFDHESELKCAYGKAAGALLRFAGRKRRLLIVGTPWLLFGRIADDLNLDIMLNSRLAYTPKDGR